MERQDKENKIGLKTIDELLGMRFFIPNYQRGYRWTKRQVTDLLNDINEFDADKDGFYCLQPLVVKQRKEDMLSKIHDAKSIEEVKNLLKGDWEVIDGQQRLTTIYILLNCLGKCDPYTLEYATRSDSATFLQKMDETKSEQNIDYHFMTQAKNTITKWLQSDFEKSAFLKKLQTKVKFIWYESIDEDPIKVFTRLNIGKIALTNSELVKALFLNSSNFGDKEEYSLRLKQQEIASEWDEIEYTLQNDEFWMFLHDEGHKSPTRIDFIFDLICEQNALNIQAFDDKKKKDQMIGTDEYRTFRYFYEYFNAPYPKEGTEQRRLRTESAWKIVKSYYQTFNEWFDDLELYHYIGFLVACGKQNTSIIEELVEEWKKLNDKEEFLRYLKRKIKNIKGIKDIVENINYQYKEDGSDKTNCRSLLLFHNVQTVINQNHTLRNNEKYKINVFYKFPFHLYKLEGWDVEHINSSIDNPENDDNTRKEWLLNVYLSANKDIQEKIKAYFATKENNELFEEIQKAFPRHEDWTPEDKNRIGNYALLDSSTNRSYGNAIFSAKRRIIIGKDKGVLIPVPKLKGGELIIGKEMDADSSFVPPCTKQVFLKYFSSTAGDNNYWTKSDAEAYKNDIQACLDKLNEK